MHRITFSVLSVFVVLPAMASARLPVVNVASAGVSARSAFGESIPTATPAKDVVAPVVATKQITPRRVVARNAVNPVVASVDAGAQIVASNNADVLMPRRPSPDLWAKSGTSLRMPTPDEFHVMRSDAVLPEESIDNKIATAPDAPAKPAISEIDTQIARLNMLQMRAEESVRSVSPRVIAAPIAETKTVSEPMPTRIASLESTNVAEPVNLRRMVVPMEAPDVVVRSVEMNVSPRIAAVRDDMSKMTPAQLRQAFRKTFLSENKHLSTYPVDNRFDVASDMSSSIEGFTARGDLSEGSGIRSLEIKIKFRNADSSLSRDNYNLLTEYAGIVVSKPTRAIQVAIPQYMTQDADERKLAARRLAIVEQVLTDNGVSKQRIVPVLSSRDEPGFVLRIISNDEYDTLTQQKRDIFGDTVGKKTYKSMSW